MVKKVEIVLDDIIRYLYRWRQLAVWTIKLEDNTLESIYESTYSTDYIISIYRITFPVNIENVLQINPEQIREELSLRLKSKPRRLHEVLVKFLLFYYKLPKPIKVETEWAKYRGERQIKGNKKEVPVHYIYKLPG